MVFRSLFFPPSHGEGTEIKLKSGLLVPFKERHQTLLCVPLAGGPPASQTQTVSAHSCIPGCFCRYNPRLNKVLWAGEA